MIGGPKDEHASLVTHAFARGEAARDRGDLREARKWLDRARRLAPGDAAIALMLAAVWIAEDNPRAAHLFEATLAIADVWEARFGLVSARFLLGDLDGARVALAAMLRCHAPRPEMIDLANRIVQTSGAPGWCGASARGVLTIHPVSRASPERRIDGAIINGNRLPPDWRAASEITVTSDGEPLIGSPISVRAIARVEGGFEIVGGALNNRPVPSIHDPGSEDSGDRPAPRPRAIGQPPELRGWAWHPADPAVPPVLEISAFQRRVTAVALEEVTAAMPHLVQPREFRVRWPAGLDPATPIHVRGLDGSALVNMDQSAAAMPPKPRRGRWPPGANSAVLVTHGDGGGVERRVDASAAQYRQAGRRVVIVRPMPGHGAAIESEGLPTLRFSLPRETGRLLQALRNCAPEVVELHHLLNHHPDVARIVRDLGVPYDAHVHDFAWFCPRIALLGAGDRYCGEPAPEACDACVAAMGSYLNETIATAALIARSAEILVAARRVIAPSGDAAARMTRHFPGLPIAVVPHDDDDAIDPPPPSRLAAGPVRICVVGGIGLHKGFFVLLACARDAARRRLKLEFTVVGSTIDDRALLDTGRVFVTGPYQPEEAVTLIRAQDAAMGFVPSIWPETWCLVLTELWRAGLRAAAFDIGAPADRIRQTGHGVVLPVASGASAINDALIAAARGRSLLPIRRSSAYKPPHECNPE